jgi:hypothetical protein
MISYREILNGAKSLFVIGSMLSDRDLASRYADYLDDLDKTQKKIDNCWKEQYPSLVEM